MKIDTAADLVIAKRWVIGLGGAVCLAAALTLTGCSQDSKGLGDAPVSHGRQGDDTAADVYNFPDTFANVSTKCVGPGFRAFVTTREAAPVVLPDPNCK